MFLLIAYFVDYDIKWTSSSDVANAPFTVQFVRIVPFHDILEHVVCARLLGCHVQQQLYYI